MKYRKGCKCNVCASCTHRLKAAHAGKVKRWKALSVHFRRLKPTYPTPGIAIHGLSSRIGALDRRAGQEAKP